MTSRVYNQLEQRVNFLRDNLLPSERGDGNYTQLERDLIKSFVLLCSAEFEEYLESRLTELNSKSQKALKAGRIPKSAASVIAHMDVSRESINKKPIVQFAIENFQYANRKISKNHGYQQSRIEKLFKSHGFEKIETFSAVLSSLDKYGKVRGEIAHKGGNQVTIVVDPVIVKSDVGQILLDLATLDQDVSSYLRSL